MLPALRRAAEELRRRRSIRDLEETLTAIVQAAVTAVPGADAGGISMLDSGKITSRSPTAASVRQLDQVQSELGEGPCITALAEPPEDGIVLVEDLAHDAESDADGVSAGGRWPRFAPQAVAAGYRSMLSTHLDVDPRGSAALNLYAADPAAFGLESRVMAGMFAVQAGMLLYGSRHAANLQYALQSRDVIGAAKGILRERFAVGDQDAFEMLVASSQETNIKLVEVARWVGRDADERRQRRGDPDGDDESRGPRSSDGGGARADGRRPGVGPTDGGAPSSSPER